jgi:hypothetical protein
MSQLEPGSTHVQRHQWNMGKNSSWDDQKRTALLYLSSVRNWSTHEEISGLLEQIKIWRDRVYYMKCNRMYCSQHTRCQCNGVGPMSGEDGMGNVSRRAIEEGIEVVLAYEKKWSEQHGTKPPWPLSFDTTADMYAAWHATHTFSHTVGQAPIWTIKKHTYNTCGDRPDGSNVVAHVDLEPLSNAQQRLEQQKILTDKAASAAKEAEDGRAKARMVLEEAQKIFSDSVNNEEEAKVTETETTSVLVALQREVDELIYAARREEIARKKRNIKETYEAQLADIAADEAALGHM